MAVGPAVRDRARELLPGHGECALDCLATEDWPGFSANMAAGRSRFVRQALAARPLGAAGEIASLSGGQVVNIAEHSLNGVKAGNAFWWKVRAQAGGQALTGWVSQANLFSYNLDEFIYLPLIEN